MNSHKVENIAAVISYNEAHLNEKLDLDTVANAICYSKYHLHRMFTDTVGITLHDYIQRRQVLIMRDGDAIIGAAAFSVQTGSIDFLAAHPQYRHYGVAKAFLDFMLCNLFVGRELSITTDREGDKADTGQREEYKRLGFAQAELLTEFGYPTQRLILPPKRGKGNNG